jgi:hypothetical protein
MRVIEKREVYSRRTVLRGGAAVTAGVVAMSVGAGGVFGPGRAWAVDAKNLKPETMQTLIQMARDIYPHDRLADKYYAVAVQGYDTQAGKDAALKATIENEVTTLDGLAAAEYGRRYVEVGWEADRVALLREIAGGAFFEKIRGGLVVGLYNQPEVWERLGYEGPSADKGGYLERGFDDLDWL